jgi:hypothetical protein
MACKSLFDLPERIQDKISPEPMSGCWVWVGAIDKHGYGSISINGTTKIAHRAVAELLGCPSAPRHLVSDHLCRLRPCVNPDHIEFVTDQENRERGNNPLSKRRLQTHCIHGHPLSGQNLQLRTRPTGLVTRHCRQCALSRPTSATSSAAEIGQAIIDLELAIETRSWSIVECVMVRLNRARRN